MLNFEMFNQNFSQENQNKQFSSHHQFLKVKQIRLSLNIWKYFNEIDENLAKFTENYVKR